MTTKTVTTVRTDDSKTVTTIKTGTTMMTVTTVRTDDSEDSSRRTAQTEERM